MVKIEEHMKKIEEVKRQVSNSKGKQKKQYLKCLNRLRKELLTCQHYLKESKVV